MKIYTRTGDDGSTALIGGDRVSKADLRIECYGTVDELNSFIGLSAVDAPVWLVEMLTPVQNELFNIGSHLATPENEPTRNAGWMPPLTREMVDRLERQIDAADAELPALKQFILPGGTSVSARLHVARTVCRRAERLLVQLSKTARIEPILVVYINRLSDWLFTIARLFNHRAGVPDTPWTKS